MIHAIFSLGILQPHQTRDIQQRTRPSGQNNSRTHIFSPHSPMRNRAVHQNPPYPTTSVKYPQVHPIESTCLLAHILFLDCPVNIFEASAECLCGRRRRCQPYRDGNHGTRRINSLSAYCDSQSTTVNTAVPFRDDKIK